MHFRTPEQLIDKPTSSLSQRLEPEPIFSLTPPRDHLVDGSDEERVQQAIANVYYEGRLTFDQVKAIVDTEAAQNFRVLKHQLTDDIITDELATALGE